MTFGMARSVARDGVPAGAGAVGWSTCDRMWAGRLRTALYCGIAFSALCVLVDWASGGPVWPGALWAASGVVVFHLLLPPRVVAGDGWLSVRGSVRVRRVRTDALRSVESYGGVATRLVLRDVEGGRVELDPRVLVENPLICHLLDVGARRSLERGSLRSGADEVFRISGVR